jgi:putative endonuclease
VPKPNASVGKLGEGLALDFLRSLGYKILAVNYRNSLGEIDIIAKDKGTLAFVEVKTRLSDIRGLPQDSIGLTKQKKLSRVAVSFLKEHNLLDNKARFDVVSIMYDADNRPKFDLFRDAFELDQRFIF